MEGARIGPGQVCPVCQGRRETAPGMGCGACRATGYIPWPRDPADLEGGGLVEPYAFHGLLRAMWGTAELEHGAAVVKIPDKFTPNPSPADGRGMIFLTIQQARGQAAAVYVSDRTASQFTIASLSERDTSLVGWLIIG